MTHVAGPCRDPTRRGFRASLRDRSHHDLASCSGSTPRSRPEQSQTPVSEPSAFPSPLGFPGARRVRTFPQTCRHRKPWGEQAPKLLVPASGSKTYGSKSPATHDTATTHGAMCWQISPRPWHRPDAAWQGQLRHQAVLPAGIEPESGFTSWSDALATVKIARQPQGQLGPDIHEDHADDHDEHVGHHAREDLVQGDVRR